MKIPFWIGAALLCWGLTSSSAQAFCPTMGCYFTPPPCCVAYQTCEVTAYRAEIKEEKVPVTIERVNYRKETSKVKVNVYVQKFFDEKIKTSYAVATPKIVEREVPRCVMVPIVLLDPCSGCCVVSCRPQWVMEKVRCVAYDYQMREREDVVKVCRYVPEERVFDQVRYIPEVTKEQSWTVRRYCVAVPYKTTIQVPVMLPCCQ